MSACPSTFWMISIGTPAFESSVTVVCRSLWIHGVPYVTGSLGSQFASAMRRLVRFAVPRRTRHGDTAGTSLALAANGGRGRSPAMSSARAGS
jgi:hypothetical protein